MSQPVAQGLTESRKPARIRTQAREGPMDRFWRVCLNRKGRQERRRTVGGAPSPEETGRRARIGVDRLRPIRRGIILAALVLPLVFLLTTLVALRRLEMPRPTGSPAVSVMERLAEGKAKS